MSDPLVHDLRPLISRVETVLARHALGPPGAYARYSLLTSGDDRDTGLDPYGVADAANLLYTLGRMPRSRSERAGFVETLRGFQDPRDGLIRERSHHPFHTTAHCLAALELFDAGPAVPLSGMHELRDPDAMERFLDSLDWAGNPWIESHRGAGLYAALWLAGETTPEWETRYFDWIGREWEAETGLLRRGCNAPPPEGDVWLFPRLAGSFHYAFNLLNARLPLPHPEALIDTCLRIEERELYPLAQFVGFAEIDWVYCLHRALCQCGHRFDEGVAALRRFAAKHVAYLDGLDADRDAGLDDLHALFGALCALAELQRALPGELRSERPLRLVLDRRPFI